MGVGNWPSGEFDAAPDSWRAGVKQVGLKNRVLVNAYKQRPSVSPACEDSPCRTVPAGLGDVGGWQDLEPLDVGQEKGIGWRDFCDGQGSALKRFALVDSVAELPGLAGAYGRDLRSEVVCGAPEVGLVGACGGDDELSLTPQEDVLEEWVDFILKDIFDRALNSNGQKVICLAHELGAGNGAGLGSITSPDDIDLLGMGESLAVGIGEELSRNVDPVARDEGQVSDFVVFDDECAARCVLYAHNPMAVADDLCSPKGKGLSGLCRTVDQTIRHVGAVGEGAP